MAGSRRRWTGLTVVVAVTTLAALIPSAGQPVMGASPTPTMEPAPCSSGATAVGGIWGALPLSVHYSIWRCEGHTDSGCNIKRNGDVEWGRFTWPPAQEGDFRINRWYCNADQSKDTASSIYTFDRLLLDYGGGAGSLLASNQWPLQNYWTGTGDRTYRLMASGVHGNLYACTLSAAACSAIDPRVHGSPWGFVNTIGRIYGGHWINEAAAVPAGSSWALVLGEPDLPSPTPPTATPSPTVNTPTSTPTITPGGPTATPGWPSVTPNHIPTQAPTGEARLQGVGGVWQIAPVGSRVWQVSPCDADGNGNCTITGGNFTWGSASTLSINRWYDSVRLTGPEALQFNITNGSGGLTSFPDLFPGRMWDSAYLTGVPAARLYYCYNHGFQCKTMDPRYGGGAPAWSFVRWLYDGTGFDYRQLSSGHVDTSFAIVLDVGTPPPQPSATPATPTPTPFSGVCGASPLPPCPGIGGVWQTQPVGKRRFLAMPCRSGSGYWCQFWQPTSWEYGWNTSLYLNHWYDHARVGVQAINIWVGDYPGTPSDTWLLPNNGLWQDLYYSGDINGDQAAKLMLCLGDPVGTTDACRDADPRVPEAPWYFKAVLHSMSWAPRLTGAELAASWAIVIDDGPTPTPTPSPTRPPTRTPTPTMTPSATVTPGGPSVTPAATWTVIPTGTPFPTSPSGAPLYEIGGIWQSAPANGARYYPVPCVTVGDSYTTCADPLAWRWNSPLNKAVAVNAWYGYGGLSHGESMVFSLTNASGPPMDHWPALDEPGAKTLWRDGYVDESIPAARLFTCVYSATVCASADPRVPDAEWIFKQWVYPWQSFSILPPGAVQGVSWAIVLDGADTPTPPPTETPRVPDGGVGGDVLGWPYCGTNRLYTLFDHFHPLNDERHPNDCLDARAWHKQWFTGDTVDASACADGIAAFWDRPPDNWEYNGSDGIDIFGLGAPGVPFPQAQPQILRSIQKSSGTVTFFGLPIQRMPDGPACMYREIDLLNSYNKILEIKGDDGYIVKYDGIITSSVFPGDRVVYGQAIGASMSIHMTVRRAGEGNPQGSRVTNFDALGFLADVNSDRWYADYGIRSERVFPQIRMSPYGFYEGESDSLCPAGANCALGEEVVDESDAGFSCTACSDEGSASAAWKSNFRYMSPTGTHSNTGQALWRSSLSPGMYQVQVFLSESSPVDLSDYIHALAARYSAEGVIFVHDQSAGYIGGNQHQVRTHGWITLGNVNYRKVAPYLVLGNAAYDSDDPESWTDGECSLIYVDAVKFTGICDPVPVPPGGHATPTGDPSLATATPAVTATPTPTYTPGGATITPTYTPSTTLTPTNTSTPTRTPTRTAGPPPPRSRSPTPTSVHGPHPTPCWSIDCPTPKPGPTPLG